MPIEDNDLTYINNMISNVTDDDVEKENLYTVSEAIEYLSNHEARISKNKKVNNDIKLIKWDYLVAQSIVSYLIEVENGSTKMSAAAASALFHFKSQRIKTSYKATCIREWAKEFLKSGSLPVYSQGKHAKCLSVIADECFQSLARYALMSKIDFTSCYVLYCLGNIFAA